VFAVDARSCATRATYSLSGAANVDWEDMARGAASDGSPVLWLADIGDNDARRSSVVVYEIAEPGEPGDFSASGTVSVRSRWTLTYPDGAHDAETLLVDPETGRPVIVTKDVAGGRSRAYRVPVAGSGVLEPLAQLDVKALEGGGLAGPAWSVTAGATSPDRRTLVLRTYLSAWVWWAKPGEPLAAILARSPTTLDVPFTRQPEAISFTRDGQGLWVTSEGAASPLHLLRLPPPSSEVRPPPRVEPDRAREQERGGPLQELGRSSLPVLGLVGAGSALLVASVGVVLVRLVRRRHRR